MKTLKANFLMIAALAIATFTMSFKLMQPVQQNLEWHEKQQNGTYSLMAGDPRPEPGNGCEEETDELCAKGFEPGTAPSVITDTTPAIANRYQPEVD